jgi:hypothetical protein
MRRILRRLSRRVLVVLQVPFKVVV